MNWYFFLNEKVMSHRPTATWFKTQGQAQTPHYRHGVHINKGERGAAEPP